ncbi:MAG: hypothetical protein FWD71_15585 [Oscillospiraceae bacterium]|nr:hypothetical protein [Oscillospiraceae bacterium]
MDKITDTNIVETLRDIMDTNTVYYKTDLTNIDNDHFIKAAHSGDIYDKTLLWLSYQGGTVCSDERNIFQQNTYGHNSWCFYHEQQARDRILAYAVEVKSIEKNGYIIGDIYELDYHKHAEFVRQNAVASDYLTVTFKNGDIQKVLKSDFHYGNFHMSDVADTRSEPNDPVALNALLEQEYEKRLAEPYNMVYCYPHTERLKAEHAQHEAARIVAEINKIPQPNTPDKKMYRVEISPYYSANPSHDELKLLFKEVPYKTMKICKFRDRAGTYAAVDKSEISKIRKPSLLDEVKQKAAEIKQSQSVENMGKVKKKTEREV